MVEVFKTNVQDCEEARELLDFIRGTFVDYRANFDLEDCDKILRVEHKGGYVESDYIINLLLQYGYKAEILEDTIPERLRNTAYSSALSQVF